MMPANERYTATRTAIRTAAILMLFTAAFTTLMATTQRLTAPSIAAAVEAERMQLIHAMLPPGSFDNALLEDWVDIGEVSALGRGASGRVLRARRNDAPVALIVDAVAPDGYSGRIRLSIAIGAAGELLGARVTEHRETPGLGDYIDPAKDRERTQPWIQQFSARQPGELPSGEWRVQKEGGPFLYRTGATLSARAVTAAIGRAHTWASPQRAALFAAPSASALPLPEPTP